MQPLPDVGFDALPHLPAAPWRCSGTVLVAVLNDAATLDALGRAVHAPPYQRPPQAPVLAVKPRHTWAAADAPFTVPAGAAEVVVGPSLACIIGRRIGPGTGAADAQQAVAAWGLAVDLTLPTGGWYRPAVRARAAVGSLRLGAPVAALPEPVAAFEVRVDGGPPWHGDMARFVRGPGALLADIAAFTTLQPGDVVLVGVPEGAPSARAGQRVRVDAPGLGSLAFAIEGVR